MKFQPMYLRNQRSERGGRNGSVRRGFTLIEVLVAILLFSVGLLGLVGIHAKTVQFSISAEDTNRAALLASNIAAKMVGAQTVSLPSAEVAQWQARVSDATVSGLPNGTGTITISGNTADILITWKSPNVATGSANAVNQYRTQFILP
jgi:type IV pilus assembly protein PilV